MGPWTGYLLLVWEDMWQLHAIDLKCLLKRSLAKSQTWSREDGSRTISASIQKLVISQMHLLPVYV